MVDETLLTKRMHLHSVRIIDIYVMLSKKAVCEAYSEWQDIRPVGPDGRCPKAETGCTASPRTVFE